MFSRVEILECYLSELVCIGNLIRVRSRIAAQSFRQRGFAIIDRGKLAKGRGDTKRERQRRLVLRAKCVNCGKPLAPASKYKCEYHLGLARESANKRNIKKRLGWVPPATELLDADRV